MREQITETKMHALDYWQVIRNRWGVILLTFFLITLASLVIIALLDKKFAGQTKFVINVSSAPNLFETAEQDNMRNRSGNWLETQFKGILSRDTLNRVVKNLNLESEWGVSADECASKLERMIEADQERGTEIVTITGWSTKAAEAASIANGVRVAYEERRTAMEVERVNRLTQNTDAQITRQVGIVETARLHMMDVMKKHNIVDVAPLSNGFQMTGVQTPGIMHMEDARRNQTTLEQEVSKLTTQLEALLLLKGDRLISGFQELNVQNSTITKLFPEYQTELAQLRSASASGFGPRHPKIVALTISTQTKWKQMEDAVEGYKTNLKVQLENAKKMVALAKENADTKTTDAVTERGKQSEYGAAKYNYESQQQLLNTMREHNMRIAVDVGVTKKPIDVLQEAKPDVNPAKPNVMMLLSIGAGLGLVLGLLLAFFLEYLDTSVKSLDDVERYLGVPVLAVIPKDVGVLHKQSGLSPDAEAYRILRTNIEFNRRSADANAITIVSGGAGEGKSTTLVNLAYICAQGGYNTLMIDGDLRRPKLHTFFDINNSVGLTNYLTTALMLEDVILQTPIENLYFMPSGILPADAAGILNSRRMSELIADVKNRFDLVLIDSPPILGVSDASVLAS
ncbi:MAG TPA: polysaccharide biosynthesis tyrosine autokinase, partial [Verrucomicrobiales bacterium]|nr:polysaccharide biosynthesis tyrosine autokinase [Verrucomicrobiales bacterium]